MRLLHTKTLEFRNFLAEDRIPPYAILSHTWGDNEVIYEDLLALHPSKGRLDVLMRRKSISLDYSKIESLGPGYSKIIGCCKQASHEGYDWVWIDT